MSRRATVLALPDEAQLPASFVKALIKEHDAGLINEAHARQLTIEMWTARGMRHYLRDFPWDGPQPDGNWDGNETSDRGHIQLVREE
jgi:hypothetical protein